MGIPGIYGEIGAGDRIALSKLAVETFEQSGRPLRIAVDISIWQFQIQSGKGGSNPALRTLYYRLLRLLSLSIQPLFVFDGPHKPTFKRNRRTGSSSVCLPDFLTKQLLGIFGFPFVIAPGEAEAECALLQREGVVDAVLSEDVDTLMFGCTRSMRNWSSEGATGGRTPTHVSVYDLSKIANGKSRLDREGMALIALMSGGDYNPAGIPGCGIKVACEAARAGFGKSLFKISRTDSDGLKAWREELSHELLSNESKHFRVKHKALKIPETFPNPDVLGYYTHPVVSSAEQVEKYKTDLQWDGELDLATLRIFVADAFEWRRRSGAIKLIRGLAPALLVWKLRVRSATAALADGNIDLIQDQERLIIKSLCGKRVHFSTDGMEEIRVSYIPADIVGLDLDAEELDTGCAEKFEAKESPPVEDEAGAVDIIPATSSTRPRAPYDPTRPEKIWILSTYIQIGVPSTYQDWDQELRDKANKPKKTATKGKATVGRARGGMKVGALDSFAKVAKPGAISQAKENPRTTPNSPAPVSVALPLRPVSKSTRSRLPSKECKKESLESSRPSKLKPTQATAKVANPATGGRRSQIRSIDLNVRQREKPRTLAKRPPETPNSSLLLGERDSALSVTSSPGAAGKPPSKEAAQNLQFHEMHIRPSSLCSQPSTACRAPSSLILHDKEAGSPSSRKKRTSNSLSRIARQRSVQPDAIDLCTPQEDHDAEFRHFFEGDDPSVPFSETKVNKRLEFSPPVRPSGTQDQEFSSSPSLPSLSALTSSMKCSVSQPRIIASSSPTLPKRIHKATPTKAASKQAIPTRLTRTIALRESLEGAWKEVDDLEAISRADVFTDVEVLDMTAQN